MASCTLCNIWGLFEAGLKNYLCCIFSFWQSRFCLLLEGAKCTMLSESVSQRCQLKAKKTVKSNIRNSDWTFTGNVYNMPFGSLPSDQAILCWVFFYSVPDDLFQNISYWPYFRKLFVYFTLPSTYQPSSICNAIRNFVYDYKCLVVSVQDTL